jgi:hypothetical protein
MADLKDVGRRLAAHPLVAPAPIDRINARATQITHRRRVARLSALAVVPVLAAAVIVAVVLPGRSTSSQQLLTTTPSVPTTVPPAPTSIPGAGSVTAGTSAQGVVPLQNVSWSSVSYPVNCGGQTTGTPAAYPSPAPGVQLAVVFVQCVHGAGSPPSAVLLYDHADTSTTPHLLQTLVTYQDDWSPALHGVTSSGANLTIAVAGYTSNAPRCCPDIQTSLTWVWQGTTYAETSQEPPHSQLPSS